MKKYLKEKPKPKKTNNQNKLKKVLYPSNTKPITLETNTGTNNQKMQKKQLNKQALKQKQKNGPTSPNSRRAPKDKNEPLMNKSQNNNSLLELDYLNFSKIELGFNKLNSSFDDDIFSSKIFKQEGKQIVSNRYNGIDSSMDTIKTDTNNNNLIEESKENLLKTPSTVCNYYDKSEAASSMKKVEVGNENENFMNTKNELRKNLDKLYENNENNKNNDIKYINVNTKQQNVVNWRLKDSIKITKNKSSNVNLKEKEKDNKDNKENKETKEKEFSKTLNEKNSGNNNNNIDKEINKIIFNIKQNNNSKTKQQMTKNENIINNNEKVEKIYRNNLMENYLNSKIKKRKNSFNMSSSKKNNYYNKMCSVPKENIAKTLKYTNNSSTKSINMQNNTAGITGNMNLKNNCTNNTNNTKNINSLININYNKTITGLLMNTNNSNLSNTCLNIENKKTNNTTNGIYYNNMQNTSNYKKGKHSTQQKPIILCYDQMKYDSYFVTPKNNSKITKGKVQSSNKSTKLDSNSRGNGNTNIKNNNTTVKNNNYNILVNTLSKAKNKSFNKNKINNDMMYKNYNSSNKINKFGKNNINNYINNKNYEKAKTNMKNNNKSSSSLIKQKGVMMNKNVDYSNTNINSILKILNSGGKENSQLLQNLLKKMNNSNTKSPMKKYKSSNALKISKTLTEQNILNRMQVTPKYYKIPKSGNAYTTTLVKKNIYINSNEKTGTEKLKNIKYNNSSIKKNYQILNSNNNYNEILGNLFNHKTQSDFKTNKYYILNNSNMNSNNNAKSNNNTNKYMINNNNEYGMDKHVKQKLLDRMNNATTNGWQFILRGNNPNNHNNGNKKVLMENLSEIMKSPNKNDFINNNTIISNESEDENEKKENNEKSQS